MGSSNRIYFSNLLIRLATRTHRYMKKRFKNESGDIEVRKSAAQFGCGIVEMMHYWDKNKSGCVIGYWDKLMTDGSPRAEFRSVDNRIATTKYDSGDILLCALQIGQKMADLLVETDEA